MTVSRPRRGQTTRLGLAEGDAGVLDPSDNAGRLRWAGSTWDNLPRLPSDFVGREAAIAEVRELVDKSRLVTLTGPGGMGKTRLALRVAALVAAEGRDDVLLVELASVADGARLPELVAAVLDRRDLHPRPQSVQDLVHRIGGRRLLLVLDNCEHLVDSCAHLVDALLRGCHGVRVLATSREMLRVAWEHTWLVGPLSLPETGSEDAGAAAASEAVELFVRRALAICPEFSLDEQSETVVVEICRRLDGMPLAIELAAARVASLTPDEILERLGDRFRLLTAGSRTADARHQTLAAALEWSHDLLSPGEAVLLRRVSVFAGWTLGDAEAVCAEPCEVEQGEVLDGLAALVAKSLVVAEMGRRVRYRMLETVRDWASAKLDVAGESPAVLGRHARWCVELAERAEVELGGDHAQVWFDRLDFEHANFQAALRWARQSGEVESGLRLAAALSTFWRIRGHLDEGLAWLEWALAANPEASASLRAKALRAVGLFRGTLGDVTSALPLLEQSSALFAQAGDDSASLCTCSPAFLMCRNPRRSFPELDKRMEFCRRTGNTVKLAHLLCTRGQAHFFLGEADPANQYFDEAMQLGRGAADGEALRGGLLGLGRVALLIGDLPGVERWVGEARARSEEVGALDDTAVALSLLGDASRTRGDYRQARNLVEKSLGLARQAGSPLLVSRCVYCLARLDECEGEVAEAGELFKQSMSLAGAGGGLGFNEARCLVGMGTVAQAAGDLSLAAGHFMDALSIAQATGAVQVHAHALDCLSDLGRLSGDLVGARTLAHQGLRFHHQIGELAAIASSLERVAGLGVGQRWESAARLLGAAQSLRDAHGYARPALEEARYQSDVDTARSKLGGRGFELAAARGGDLSTKEAVTYAVRGRGTRGRPSTGWDSLTPCERDVVRLVGQGLTNAEIGQQLFTSPRTVGHHLGHAYTKLGIRSRAVLVKELSGRQL